MRLVVASCAATYSGRLDAHLPRAVRGLLAAQTVAPQARVLAHDRGIEVLLLDYDEMRGVDDVGSRLF